MSMPDWISNLPLDKIIKACYNYQVPRALIAAIVSVESSGNPFAMRYESGWSHYLTPHIFASNLGITYDTEKICQATSWGLMQVMGAVAREMGFVDYLVKLCDPEIGLKLGCNKIKNLLSKYNLDEAVSAYNCGTPKRVNGKFSNQEYVTKVMIKYREITPP